LRRRAALALAALAALALGAPTSTAHPGHGPVTIAVEGYKYSPADITVGVGDSVIWYFSGVVDRNHSVTSDPGQADSFDSDPGVASPPTKRRFSYYARSFPAQGKFTYYCKNHSGMRGTIKVLPVAGTIDNVPPTVSRLKLSTRHVLTFDLSEKADVIARILERRKGKWRTVRDFDMNGRQGANRRKVSYRRLKRGAHRLQLRAYDSGGLRSARASLSFRVRRALR
jgi:plastocyanin